MASCIMYKNTGFTPVNLPYDEAALNTAAEGQTEAVTMDLIQIYKLPRISVKAFETDVMDVDYIKLSMGNDSAFYAVYDYAMTSMDVATLMLSADPGMTAGGWQNVNLVNGMWSRAYDYLGGTMVVDSLLQLNHYPHFKYKSFDSGFGGLHLIASMVDLEQVPDSNDSAAYFFDEATGAVKVGVTPVPVELHTTINMAYSSALVDNSDTGNKLITVTNGYAIYNYNNPAISKAVEDLRAFGYESAIIGSWRVPFGFFESTVPEDINTATRFSELNMKGASIRMADLSLPEQLYEGEDVASISELIEHSDFYRLGVLSSSTGAKAERRRAETTGLVAALYDPRKNGCPVYILQDRISDAEDASEKFAYLVGEMQKCSVQGGTWDDVPIVYQGASGSAVNYMKLLQKEQFANETYHANRENLAIGMMAGMFGAGFNGAQYVSGSPASYYNTPDFDPMTGNGYNIETMTSPGAASQFSVAAGAAGSGFGTLAATAVASDMMDRARIQDARSSMAAYVVNNKMVAPQMTSQTIEAMQQYTGNSAIVYAMYPDKYDLMIWGEIAAMFGVATNRPVDRMIARPVTCCFFQGSGIQCTTAKNVPQSVRKDVGELLNIGVRLWVTKPRRLTWEDWANREGGGSE